MSDKIMEALEERYSEQLMGRRVAAIYEFSERVEVNHGVFEPATIVVEVEKNGVFDGVVRVVLDVDLDVFLTAVYVR